MMRITSSSVWISRAQGSAAPLSPSLLRACKTACRPFWLRSFHSSSSCPARKPFTRQEDEQMVQFLMAGKSKCEVARLLGRPFRSIWSRIKSIGIKPPRLREYYTAEETAKLLHLTNKGVAWEEIRTHFPDRTCTALRNTQARLKNEIYQPMNNIKHRFSREEDRRILDLRDNASSPASWTEIARKMGRTPYAVQSRYTRCVPEKALRTTALNPRRWTAAQMEGLRGYVSEGMQPSDIAPRLGRTETSVRNKIHWIKRDLNDVDPIDAQRLRRPWSAEDSEYLRALGAGRHDWAKLATRMGRSAQAIYSKWYALRQD